MIGSVERRDAGGVPLEVLTRVLGHADVKVSQTSSRSRS
jgi:hypothetical protein